MTGLALALILVSAVAHASWNFLVKRGTNQEVFLWSAQATIAVLLLPLGLVLAWQSTFESVGWWFVLATIILHIVYFIFLGRGYSAGDLSIVYPVSRGIGPIIVPFLGVLILGEDITLPAILGIIFVVIGIYTVYWWGQISRIVKEPLSFVREPGTRYAILTGLVIASYSVVDKVGVSHVTPFLYMYLMSVGVTVGWAPYIFRSYGTAQVRMEWQLNRTSIFAVALLLFLAYGLVLSALQFSQISYIWPSREVGIVVGVTLGALVLKEPFGQGRILGSLLIVVGLAFLVLAP